LIHLELDEFSAARLICQALRAESPSSYSLELDQLVTNRQVEKVSVPALATAKMPLYDYFHLQSLARGLYQAGESKALKEVLDHTANVWPSSPLKLTFAMHQGFEAGQFGVAQDAAESLAAKNQKNGDYFYFTGVAQLKSGNFKGALESLTRASKLVGESDGEIISLIGQCHVALGDLQKAESILKRSISLIQSAGYPATRERLALSGVEEELRGDALNPALEMPRTTRMWLVNLSPRRYYELQNAQESEVEHILRPMGATPNQGDFCFFATTVDLDSGGQQWKIGAIYTVDSEPIWHPTEKYQNSLQLVARPPGGIPVDVVLMEDDMDEEATGEVGSHPYSFGVFELEMGALDIITEAVRMKNEGMIEESVSVKGRVG
jgi:tetratricopeptide (TPR) repeat protein